MALADELKSVLKLSKGDASKLAKVVVDVFGALTWEEFKSMKRTNIDKAIGVANLGDVSLEKLNKVSLVSPTSLLFLRWP